MTNDNKDAIVADLPVISHKTEKIQLLLEGEDYLKFNGITARLIFSTKMNERKTREAVVNLALTCFYALTEKLVKNGAVFIQADADKIIKDAVKPEIDFEVKYNDLVKTISHLKFTESPNGFELSEKGWKTLMIKAGVDKNED